MLGIVEHLVRRASVSSRNGEELLHVVHIEVGNAPGANLALRDQLLESFNRVPKRISASPVQQIEVDCVRRRAA